MTSKQRSTLKSLSNALPSVFQIGKGGVSTEIEKALDSLLEKRELIKITVLKNADEDKTDLSKQLAKSLNAEVVQVIGGKIVLYRLSKRKDIVHIELD